MPLFSDIDVTILGQWPGAPLHTLAEALERAGFARDVEVIQARVSSWALLLPTDRTLNLLVSSLHCTIRYRSLPTAIKAAISMSILALIRLKSQLHWILFRSAKFGSEEI